MTHYNIGDIISMSPHKERPEMTGKQTRTIRVYDDRFGKITHVGTHANVPTEWTCDEILKRLGIGRHLRVYEDIDGHSRTIQPYVEWPSGH